MDSYILLKYTKNKEIKLLQPLIHGIIYSVPELIQIVDELVKNQSNYGIKKYCGSYEKVISYINSL